MTNLELRDFFASRDPGAIRSACGLTLDDLSAGLRVHRQRIHDWECRRYRPVRGGGCPVRPGGGGDGAASRGDAGRGGVNGKTISDDEEITMTTETPAMTAGQIDARLREIAPPPEWGTSVTARDVARYFAVCAMLGYARNLTPFIRPDQEVPASLVCAQFAAARALLALAFRESAVADEVAREITDTWCGGDEIGGWLYEHLTALGVDPAEVARLDGARLALENAGETAP